MPLHEIDEEQSIIWLTAYYASVYNTTQNKINIEEIIKNKDCKELEMAINKMLERIVEFCGV